jgi:hypothetical protein
MSRAQAQYLRIFTVGGLTLQRWHSFYGFKSVSYNGFTWQYQNFSADGFTDGDSGDETNMSISAPATPIVVTAFEQAIRDGIFVQVDTYEFDDEIDDQTPQADQQIITSVIAQVISGSATITSMNLQIGSALSPVGAQCPPRTLTTAIMGAGCQL